ncbi:class I SAM-dependent methyltransferase [Fusibacter ferrireducens]|uniref:Class I SAM-dependent methyltransferase n=1 Tax=Fusibacter ferrireducens TaxID=2785058 RepID=A0ABR9ZZZ3_9FIRM|nr:class I SAM-dependent methyltransferase [Fusibacter ferrireducens]MBF4695748.1 class I SAM-dependent methyltransferase [Fusibacter ferrireducens]
MLKEKRNKKAEITFKTLASKLVKPALYEDGDLHIWKDEHISKGMLEAHLSEATEAASRNAEFIDSSVEWISQIAPVAAFPKLLDLGCGPGLYSERFRRKGYEVTGVDFSNRSIEYARKHACLTGLAIDYICSDYLQVALEQTYDVITLIYCDFGALKVDEQLKLLMNVNRWLKPGGKFIFDVLTKHQFEDQEHTAVWNLEEISGYWKPHPYICMTQQFDYDDDIKLFQYLIIDACENMSSARVWTHYFSKESIGERLSVFPYRQLDYYSDISGKSYEEPSKTLCMVIEK